MPPMALLPYKEVPYESTGFSSTYTCEVIQREGLMPESEDVAGTPMNSLGTSYIRTYNKSKSSRSICMVKTPDWRQRSSMTPSRLLCRNGFGRCQECLIGEKPHISCHFLWRGTNAIEEDSNLTLYMRSRISL